MIAQAQTNRGRIQAQGSDPVVEVSQPWVSNSVPTKSQGIVMLDDVWNSLTPTQQKDRLKAYSDAKVFINNSPAGGTCIYYAEKNISRPTKKRRYC